MRYHNITKDDMLNGDGLRVVLWVAGCSHHCNGCQNPCTWDPNGGIEFDSDAKKELFDELEKDYVSGITFSGGDPHHEANDAEVLELMREIKSKYPNKTIWYYTGSSWKEDKLYEHPLAKYVDVLVDGEYDEKQRDVTLLWRGSSNQTVINVPATMQKKDPSEPVKWAI